MRRDAGVAFRKDCHKLLTRTSSRPLQGPLHQRFSLIRAGLSRVWKKQWEEEQVESERTREGWGKGTRDAYTQLKRNGE